MYIKLLPFFGVNPMGKNATPPIEPLATRPGSLLLLAGSSLLRRPAYPDAPPAAHSVASN